MAQKRMFDKSIIDSDDFLDMPLTSQAVYFHLNMRADDYGFVDNWKSTLRIIGGKEDDLKVLISKNFVIPFESGVIVIKHWKLNNNIQKDRIKATKYINELHQLKLNECKEYELLKNDELTNITLQIENKEIPEWQRKRDDAYKKSSLPYSFLYKIRNAFDNEICPICGKVMRINSSNKANIPSIQHLKPISKGGEHELDNIAIICLECNMSINNEEINEKLNSDLVKNKWEEITRLTSGYIDKNSIDKNSIDKNSIEENSIEENIYEFVEENFGRTLNPIEYEEISKWEDNELTRYAIRESILNGARSIKYIRTFIENLKAKNILTVEEAIKDKERYKKNKENKSKSSMDRFNDTLDEWAKQQELEEALNNDDFGS